MLYHLVFLFQLANPVTHAKPLTCMGHVGTEMSCMVTKDDDTYFVCVLQMVRSHDDVHHAQRDWCGAQWR